MDSDEKIKYAGDVTLSELKEHCKAINCYASCPFVVDNEHCFHCFLEDHVRTWDFTKMGRVTIKK